MVGWILPSRPILPPGLASVSGASTAAPLTAAAAAAAVPLVVLVVVVAGSGRTPA
jgi:hypothetical protein